MPVIFSMGFAIYTPCCTLPTNLIQLQVQLFQIQVITHCARLSLITRNRLTLVPASLTPSIMPLPMDRTQEARVSAPVAQPHHRQRKQISPQSSLQPQVTLLRIHKNPTLIPSVTQVSLVTTESHSSHLVALFGTSITLRRLSPIFSCSCQSGSLVP